ncbi:GNAT family N-acetyltransferase [Micromonospora pisi]|nr:GNAT family N-acetyltransferase [Micromonospora pisi]
MGDLIVRALIATPRLELRPFRVADADELHTIFSDPETHTIGDGPFTSTEQTRAWIRRRVQVAEETGLLWYAVRARPNGDLLGNCGLFFGRIGQIEPEIGYEIRHSHQGQGFAREAAQAVLDEGLAAAVPRVWATIRPYNVASLRIAAKIGMSERYTKVDARGPLIYLARP